MLLPSFFNLHGRIFFVFWLTIFLVFSVFFTIYYTDPRLKKEIPHHLMKRVHMELKHLKDNFKEAENPVTLGNFIRKQPNRRVIFFLTDENFNPIPGQNKRNMRTFHIFSRLIAKEGKAIQQHVKDRVILGPFKQQLGVKKVNVFMSLKAPKKDSFLFFLFEYPFLIFLLVLVISTPLLLWFSWTISKPVRALEEAAKRVSSGNLTPDPSLEKGGSKELQSVGKSFNTMALSIDEMLQSHQRLLYDISHELCSPLARLQLAADLAKNKENPERFIDRIIVEADSLNQMIKHTLALSKTNHTHILNKETYDLHTVFKQLLENCQFEAKCANKRLNYAFHLQDNTEIYCCLLLIQSLVENVIRNAIFYSKTHIKCDFYIKNDNLVIKIEDDGPGVNQSELGLIFKPFYRTSTSRERKTGGSGLGLSIAQNAILQHKGTIKAFSHQKESLGGLLIEISLPLSE